MSANHLIVVGICLAFLVGFSIAAHPTFNLNGFYVTLPNNGGNANYEFGMNNSEYCSPSNPNNNCGPYSVWWRSIGNFPCNGSSPNGGQFVNLNSLDWTLNTANNSFNLSCDTQSPKNNKPGFSGMTFTQTLVPAENNKSSFMKFSILVQEYQYLQGPSVSNDCVYITVWLSNSATQNQSQINCSTINGQVVAYVQNAFFQLSLDSFGGNASAFNPQNASQNQAVDVKLACQGDAITFVYSHFPNGWTLAHDPVIGVSSSPVGDNNTSKKHFPVWGYVLIGLGVLVVLAVVVSAMGTGYWFYQQKKRSGFESL